jgi:hypothetical protein
MTSSVTNLLHAGSERVRPSLPAAVAVRRRAERRRHTRRIAAGVTSAVIGALVLGVSTVTPLLDSEAPTGGSPPPAAADVLLSSIYGLPLRTGVPSTALSSCVSSPRTWGAAEAHGARYADPEEPQVHFNEFVLRFESTAAAHRAVTDAWSQFLRCPTPPQVITDPLDPPAPLSAYHFDEWFSNQRARFATRQHLGQPVAMYALRVARRNAVVVVIEDTGAPDDRAELLLSQALSRATGR